MHIRIKRKKDFPFKKKGVESGDSFSLIYPQNFTPFPAFSWKGPQNFRRIPGEEIGVLLVALNRYDFPSWTLYHCVQDVQKVRRLFIDAYGIPAGNIRGLYDRHATKGNIMQALRELVRKYKYRAYVHSGHGFQVQNRATGKHVEGLVTAKMNWSRSGMFLYVDLLNITDCPEMTWLFIGACNSGGMIDKSLNPDPEKRVRVKSISAPSGGVDLGNLERPEEKGISGLFACQKKQKAYETNKGDVFLTNLCDILLYEPDLTQLELLDRLGQRITVQNPVISGPYMDLGIFCVPLEGK